MSLDATPPEPPAYDLNAGARRPARPFATGAQTTPRVLVFDSGLGGVTVLAALRRASPDHAYEYLADDAAFPYGRLSEAGVVARVLEVVGEAIGSRAPDLVVIACNTASTAVLGPLRARFAIPVVGTVPAVKPAVAASRSGLVSVLATPGCVARDYTRELVRAYAGTARVTLVGAPELAALAEARMRGQRVADGAIAEQIAPCFIERDGARTDAVALGCTHYPLLLADLERLAPWPVTWVDPAPAVARRVAMLLGPGPGGVPRPAHLSFTSGREPGAELLAALGPWGVLPGASRARH